MSLNQAYGNPSVRTLPANRSLVIADSLYRDIADPNQNPYNFICNLSGTALIGKELIYQRLYWSQPLYSHTNGTNELRFQINGDTSTTYVVYATPYLMFTQYDGNPSGTSFLPPQLYSYASNLELGLNGDVRNILNNTLLINGGTGILKDANGFIMTPQFRYSPTRGFVIRFKNSVNPDIPVYTIRLLPCNFIEQAHYVHGFGIIEAANPTTFIPRDGWTAAYFSDDTPTLLPIRYIVVTSPELNKDRRMISFQNSRSSGFLNELAIIPLSSPVTGAFHSEVLRSDATVISKRDDYNPQSFRILILDEHGSTIYCDDIIGNLFSSPTSSLYPAIMQTFFSGALANRGSPNFTNYLLFGANAPQALPLATGVSFSLNTVVGQGIQNFTRNSSPYGQSNVLINYLITGPDYGLPTLLSNAWPLVVTDTFIPPDQASSIGMGSSIDHVGLFAHDNDLPPGTGVPQSISNSLFYYTIGNNPTPTVRFDLTISIEVLGIHTHQIIYFFVGFYSYTYNRWICGNTFNATFKIWPDNPLNQFVHFSSTLTPPLQLNPLLPYGPPFDPLVTQKGMFFLIPYFGSGGPSTETSNYIATIPPGGKFVIGNASPPAPAPFGDNYMAPRFSEGIYSFGNPQATALCEDLIHEIGTFSAVN